MCHTEQTDAANMQHGDVIPDVVTSLMDISRTSTSSTQFVTLVGAAMGVLCRLRSVDSPETADPLIDKLKVCCVSMSVS